MSLCTIGQHLVDTPEPYKSALIDLLKSDGNNGGVSADRVAKIMREAGLKAAATTIRLHRAQTCVCSQRGINE